MTTNVTVVRDPTSVVLTVATTGVTVVQTPNVTISGTSNAGPTGATGPGVAVGGTAAQVLAKIDATDFNTHWITPTAYEAVGVAAALVDDLSGVTDAETARTNLGLTYLPFAPRLETGRYYKSAISTSSAAPTQSTEHASPIYIGKTCTLNQIGVNVTVLAAASVVRCGIRRDNAGVPGTVLLDAGTVATTSTGDKLITISQALTPGWYWLCAVSQGGAPTLSIVVGGNPYISGYTGATGFSGNLNAYCQTGVTGALTDAFTVANINYGITVMVRVA